MEKQHNNDNPPDGCAVIYTAKHLISVSEAVHYSRTAMALDLFQKGKMDFDRMEFADKFNFKEEPEYPGGCVFVFHLKVHGLTPFYERKDFEPGIIAALINNDVGAGQMQVFDNDD